MNKEEFFLGFITVIILLSLIIYINYKIYLMENIHPVMLIIFMLFYNILLSFMMSEWSESYLYSIMLILIMVSGLLVMFLYFVSLISNEKMEMKSFNWLSVEFIMYSGMMLVLLFVLMMNNNLFYKMYWGKMSSEINVIKLGKFMNLNIKMFYEYPMSNITIMCMIYLLLCLIIIVKMCSIKYSSLRMLGK